jgi:hypothetical protein
MGLGTQAPIRHEPITGFSGRVDLWHRSASVGEAGRAPQLQEQARAGVEQPEEPGDGHAAPRPLRRGLTGGLLEGRGLGPGAARAPGQRGAMPRPPPVPCPVGLPGGAEAC